MTDRPRYHHGDLRNALIEAGVAVLEAEGIAGVRLRGVAAKAGVSHAAPAHYFPTLKALLTALATVAFERFDKAMTEARAAAPADPSSQLAAAADGYLRFAAENTNLFRLMFSADRIDWTDLDLQRAAIRSRQQLTDVTAPAADARRISDPDARLQLEHLVWATAHGYAHLFIEGKLGASAKAPDLAALLFGPMDAG